MSPFWMFEWGKILHLGFLLHLQLHISRRTQDHGKWVGLLTLYAMAYKGLIEVQ